MASSTRRISTARCYAIEPVGVNGSGLPTVAQPEALDVMLCWGWIDGLRKSFDEKSFLQRYTPRRAKSIWSQVNRVHVARRHR